ncbi:MAG: LTA synthase family protein, partial [Firmicutes bacterium]|nr:LTA synthase family protein [Bacillota bacterium]
KVVNFSRKVYPFSIDHPLLSTLILAFLINFVMECLGRRNPIDGIVYLFTNPIMFFYNVLIIMMTLSVALLFKRRVFITFLVSLVWVGCAIANCVLLGFRTTPFSAIDLTMVTYALSIIDIYLSKIEIVLVSALILIALSLIIFIALKAPKLHRKVRYIKALAVVIAMGLIVTVATTTVLHTGLLTSRFDNLADAYKNYGFAYCLSNSFIDSGIDKPDDYNEETIDAINDNATAIIEEKDTPEQHPNIIFLQLESFFDPNRINDLYYSRNPIPNFTAMSEEGISGKLNVATVSAGTANTEFEILTGMSLQFFGAGEYPYKTILLETTCESMANNLRDLGYSTTAIHNNRASFYGRNEVFPNLGFDTFIAKEYMMDMEYTPVSWVKDKVLTKEIIGAMEVTENSDYVFAISVQGHGKYPTAFNGKEDYSVYVYGEGEEDRIAGFSYLVNQYYEMDLFLKELTDALEDFGEDTVLVAYGDHLPGLNLAPEDLSNNTLFQTDYVVWSNFELEGEDKDLYTYQLGSYVLDLLGIHQGTMNRYQQTAVGNEDYEHGMELLQYDMLYGENYSHDGVNPYVANILQMGIYDITISHALMCDGDLYLFGENLTEASGVYIGDELWKTSYYNPNMVVVRNAEINPGDVISVKQAGKNKKPLSTSNEIIYNGEVFEADALPAETE